jgi:hypothetical protein
MVVESTGTCEDLVQNEGPVMYERDLEGIAKITRVMYAGINTYGR